MTLKDLLTIVQNEYNNAINSGLDPANIMILTQTGNEGMRPLDTISSDIVYSSPNEEPTKQIVLHSMTYKNLFHLPY